MDTSNRRGFLAGSALLGASMLGLPGCGRSDGAASGKQVRFAWWGNDERDQRTREAISLFEKRHKGTTVRPQITNWDGYWDKLATQTAGGNPPDLIQMDYAYITEYAKRDTLLPLDKYIPEKLGVSDFNGEQLESGSVDGKLYGLSMGMNSVALYYNKTQIEKLGLEMPDNTMTWADYADFCARVSKKSGDGRYGTPNGLLSDVPFECWLRQRGKSFFTAGGKLGFDVDDFVEWITYWDELSKAGVAMPAEVQTALSGDMSDAPIVTGKAPFGFFWSNQLTALSASTEDEIGIHMFPQGDGPNAEPGQFYKASMFLSISSETSTVDASLALANALLTDSKVAGKLGFERGVPASPEVRKALVADASPEEKATAEYIEMLSDKVGKPQPPPPQRAAEVEEAYVFATEQAAFHKQDIRKAAEKFVTDAEEILG